MVLFFKIITEFGGPFAVLGVGVLVLCLFGLREGIRFCFTVGISLGVCLVLKEIFKNPRPNAASALTNASGYSFPSMHTVTAVLLALYVFFAIVWYNKFSLPLKIGAACDLTILAALVGWSRVYLKVHFWEDVFAGAILGIMLYFMLTLLFDIIFKQKLSRRCKSLKDTKRLARAFAAVLRKRKAAIVLLEGSMGAGKTTFVRHVIKTLDARCEATSPTFSIINKYNESIYHVDLYRVENVAELYNTDFYEMIAARNIIFIEWSEKFDIDYPRDSIIVKISMGEDGSRVFNITC